ncbi:MAG: KpsF/GutQ family sugar-phosphate isomerase [Pseudomonadota bacterium]|nr:KpsF/GutQ family sugar-phosphate isomerase [Pseudomonadota bacterium]
MPPSSSFDADRALALARATLDIEARALDALKDRQGEGFVAALGAILACGGRVVVMGMGKSGHVGRKVAATLASTGTPSFFVHPGEASHGDLGMVTAGDVVLAISNSGESDEIAAIVPAIKRLGVTLIAMTGHVESSLGRHADVVISSAVDQEACPLNLAPTASTTAQMALGDALAVALLDARGFREDDFARSHPGGSLGRKLLMHVADLMRSGDAVPRVGAGTVMAEMLHEMTSKGLGFTAVCDDRGRVAGIFTDGDLRRLIETGADLRAMRAEDVMSASPKLVRDDALAVEAAELMERHRVTGLLVVDAANALVGAINSNDLMRAKVI